LLIGILSDSHGRADVTARAVQALRASGAELLLHLGDVGGEAVLDELIGHHARIVLGNCDVDERGLTHYARAIGVIVDHPIGRLKLDGRRIAFTHGHIASLMQEALGEGVDYLLHGHTHEPRDDRIGPTRIINPGALSRASRYTAAVLEPGNDRLEIITIPKE
jgi:putative phosphoesterase